MVVCVLGRHDSVGRKATPEQSALTCDNCTLCIATSHYRIMGSHDGVICAEELTAAICVLRQHDFALRKVTMGLSRVAMSQIRLGHYAITIMHYGKSG